MVESAKVTSFLYLWSDKTLFIEVLLNLDYVKAQEFLHLINKNSRVFLTENFCMIQRGFENEGLLTH